MRLVIIVILSIIIGLLFGFTHVDFEYDMYIKKHGYIISLCSGVAAYIIMGLVLYAAYYDDTYNNIKEVKDIVYEDNKFSINGIEVNIDEVYHTDELNESYTLIQVSTRLRDNLIKLDVYSHSILVVNEEDWKELQLLGVNGEYIDRRNMIVRHIKNDIREKQENEQGNGQVVEKVVDPEFYSKLNEIESELSNINYEISLRNRAIEELNERIAELEKEKKQVSIMEKLVVGVVIWLILLISIHSIVNLRLKYKRNLIETASNAKIREGVMLDKK